MGDKNKDIFLIVEIKDRHKDMPGFHDIKFHFEINRFSNVEAVRDDAGLSPDAYGTQADDVIARSLGWIQPFHDRLDVSGMEVVIHHFMRRPCLHDLALVQQNRAGTHRCV